MASSGLGKISESTFGGISTILISGENNMYYLHLLEVNLE